MSIESVRIHPAAPEEAEAAMDWYARQSMRAAGMFLNEPDRAIEQIARNPERYAADEFGARRMLLRRFPFLIIYRKASAGVELIAVAHGRRRPKYWRERLGHPGGPG